MAKSENLKESAVNQRIWQETKVNNTWEIFKYMAEFVEGYEKLTSIGPCVSILVRLAHRQQINITN